MKLPAARGMALTSRPHAHANDTVVLPRVFPNPQSLLFSSAAAVKYGIKQKGYPDPKTGATRWMYTLDNLVYITDETSTKEITSYYRPVNIPMAPMTPADMWHHEKARENMRRNPHLCTSHTVIVVDHSRQELKKEKPPVRMRVHVIYRIPGRSCAPSF